MKNEVVAGKKNGRTARVLLLSLISLLFLLHASFFMSCSSSDGVFRMEGRFLNLNQGEFYIYNADKGWKDTISIRDGRFTYEIGMTDTTILALIFPNQSEIPIFARSGANLKIKGDASHLRGTEVEGTKENEEMTAFRLRAAKMTPPEIAEEASKYILAHPASQVSYYLLQHYFLLSLEPNYPQAKKLCDAMLKATPANGTIVRLNKQLTSLAASPVGGKIPTFKATDMNGKSVSNSQLKSDVNIVMAWSTWSYESKNIMKAVRRLQKKDASRMAVVSICVDASPSQARLFLRSDSISWPNICDGKMWLSPAMQQLGFAAMPSNLIADKKGKIICRDLTTVKAMEEKIQSLLDKK